MILNIYMASTSPAVFPFFIKDLFEAACDILTRETVPAVAYVDSTHSKSPCFEMLAPYLDRKTVTFGHSVLRPQPKKFLITFPGNCDSGL